MKTVRWSPPTIWGRRTASYNQRRRSRRTWRRQRPIMSIPMRFRRDLPPIFSLQSTTPSRLKPPSPAFPFCRDSIMPEMPVLLLEGMIEDSFVLQLKPPFLQRIRDEISRFQNLYVDGEGDDVGGEG